MLFDTNNRRKKKSLFPSTFEDMINEFGERSDFAKDTVDESIAAVPRDSKTGLRSFTTMQFFDAFWETNESEFSNLFYSQALAFIGNEEAEDEIWMHAYHLYGLLVWDRIVDATEEWVYENNYDAKKDCYFETMNKRYTERAKNG